MSHAPTSPSGPSPQTFAIVVTYHPDLPGLERLLAAIAPQVQGCLVVDNHSGDTTCTRIGQVLQQIFPGRSTLIALPQNEGIARAQNQGIAQAQAQGASHVILFDQDSLPAPDMLEQLHAVLAAQRARGVAVAAVGPCYRDERQQNPPPFIRIEGLTLVRATCDTPDAAVSVDYLIASGCLMPMHVLQAVGLMREDLFIDYVDIEWGLRARRHGYQSFGSCGAHMAHDLGENPIYFRGRALPLHSPLRHYYHFRNAVRLYCDPGLPWNWKLVDGWRLFLKYGFYTLMARPRHRHFLMMTRGILHGLIGRMGPYPS